MIEKKILLKYEGRRLEELKDVDSVSLIPYKVTKVGFITLQKRVGMSMNVFQALMSEKEELKKLFKVDEVEISMPSDIMSYCIDELSIEMSMQMIGDDYSGVQEMFGDNPNIRVFDDIDELEEFFNGIRKENLQEDAQEDFEDKKSGIELLRREEEESLMREIDESLDSKNKEKFKEYSRRLKDFRGLSGDRNDV